MFNIQNDVQYTEHSPVHKLPHPSNSSVTVSSSSDGELRAAPCRFRLVAILLCSLAATAAGSSHGRVLGQVATLQDSGVAARLRGVSAVSDRVVWASGTNGTVVRTLDAGASWEEIRITPAEALDVRDVDAFDENTAYALSIGSGTDSRIFKTVDGGANWVTQFVNDEPLGFFDAMSFWDSERGVAVSDSIDGRFYVLLTADGGGNWTRVPAAGLPAALPGEGYFAASGTNVTTWGADHVWFGTGAAAQARVGRSTDGGRTWEIAVTPLPAGPSTGIFSIAFRDADHGIVVGGVYRLEDQALDNAAITEDGGRTWSLVEGRPLSGFRSAVGYVPGSATPTLIAVGPTGADISRDDGHNWAPLTSPLGLHTLSFAPTARTGWAAGNDGKIVRFSPSGR